MQRCLELAELGMGTASPNPLVGAVVVYKNKIIGEGYHQSYGKAHAEVNAINMVLDRYPDIYSKLLRDSTIYVNLEPCSHFGKTPPCADLIIRHEIPRVVVGSPDPFMPVNGKGVEKLHNAGIEVIENFNIEACRFVNRRFFTRTLKQRPYIILKWAQTASNHFAPLDHSQKWISGQDAKALNHRWRTEEDAILVGKNTALTDNPRLSARNWPGRNPIRIIIDKNLELPQSLNIFDQTQDTIIFNALKTEYLGRIKYLQVENFDLYLPQMICYQLYIMDVQSLIIEGGLCTLTQFIGAGLWDEARIFTSPVQWKEGLNAPFISEKAVKSILVGQDTLSYIFNKESFPPPNDNF